ncbi:MAG: SpoIIE family protein phosphatase, partial [Bacteroidales bacterium]|nr:SpoIIE family protein phosphatase [Bacteroidales bacterium]
IWKQWWFYVITIIFVMSLIISYIKKREYNLLREKRILEEKVMERTEKVVRQKEEIEIQRDAIKGQRDLINAKNKNITDSIRYASNIQSAVFPPLSLLDKLLVNSFIINRPKDIVSGDFYWLTKRNGKIIVTIADCTGHGVPGAFMSMLGITFLNEIVNNQGITQANEILYHLRENVIIALRQTSIEETASDGMDIALCVIDHKKNQLQFSGAFNPLVLIRNKEVQLYKGDYITIGISYHLEGSFSLHEIDIQKGDIIYMFSDGYADQFGGEKGKKFSNKRFRELLLDIHEKSMKEQKNILEQTMENWMKETEQIDDITLMGVRL